MREFVSMVLFGPGLHFNVKQLNVNCGHHDSLDVHLKAVRPTDI